MLLQVKHARRAPAAPPRIGLDLFGLVPRVLEPRADRDRGHGQGGVVLGVGGHDRARTVELHDAVADLYESRHF